MTVGIYLRVSTEEQRERQSIATQRDFGLRYCGLHELPIFETYADDGFAGTIPFESRPAGIRLLADARQRKFDQLLVFKLDRLGRDARLILNTVHELKKYDVRVRSMTEEFDTATATGQLMLTMLSGFAAHEREVIRERSVAGTNRLAESGAWLGGIVPYGYCKQGERGDARLVITDDRIPGFTQSEADIVRLIFRMSAVEKRSCQKIADHLNRAGLPCSSAANCPAPERGKRARRIAPLWRPSHVRNMIVNRTYMGEHVFGKRSKLRNRPHIIRKVEAIVTEEQFQDAQQVLIGNRIMSKRNCQTPYLLKGLIKCGLCGLTFSGMRVRGQKDYYYRCNGRQFARGLYGEHGKKCPAKSLNGDYIERLVWADIESFLRNPREILGRLRERISMQDGERPQRMKELEDLKQRLQQKSAETDRVLTLFRRGRIDDVTLDQQLDLIKTESGALHSEIEACTRTLGVDRTAELQSAETLLTALRDRLEKTVPVELKQRIIAILVENIRSHTVEHWGVPQSEIVITYRFSQPDEPAAVVLPQLHRLSSRLRPVEQLNTLGDHLRRRRLMLKLFQHQVAAQLSVTKSSIHNWEANRSKPSYAQMPAIILFLGYDPMPAANAWGTRLVQARTRIGISQKESARRIGVDPSTLARWERGEREPSGDFEQRARQFLTSVDAA